MQDQINTENIYNSVKNSACNFDSSIKETTIILAAGHGKRIKSKTSKMLHKIWEKPTVERVVDACVEGLGKSNIIVVVGIKAEDVIESLGNHKNVCFAYQEIQEGTGHAVKIGLSSIPDNNYDGYVYVLPGDMGLIDKETMQSFRNEFISSKSDMMVLIGLYEGSAEHNSYGRIIRVKEKDIDGKSSGSDFGKVIEIIEHKDILALSDERDYVLSFNNKKYSYSKKELIENNEFNSGVYAFTFQNLQKFISEITSNNAQKEIYITDLISIYNQHELTVGAVSPKDQNTLMGFNNKSVLHQMDSIARHKVYNLLKDIIEIEDPEDFFIHDKVIKEIIEHDKNGDVLDISIGKGVYLGKGVKINSNLNLKKNVFVDGNIHFGKNVTVWQNVHISTFPNQTMKIGDHVEIFWNNIIKGNLQIGENSRIESSVNMTGSDEYPTRIGKNVTIKGTSYIFGSKIDDDIFVEHSVLIKKQVDRHIKKNGEIQKVRFYLPMPEGIDSVSEL